MNSLGLYAVPEGSRVIQSMQIVNVIVYGP